MISSYTACKCYTAKIFPREISNLELLIHGLIKIYHFFALLGQSYVHTQNGHTITLAFFWSCACVYPHTHRLCTVSCFVGYECHSSVQ